MGAIGVMGPSCNSLLPLLHDLNLDKIIQKQFIMKAMNISIRTSGHIFYRRNKPLTNPELLTIFIYLLTLIVLFFFCFIFCYTPVYSLQASQYHTAMYLRGVLL